MRRTMSTYLRCRSCQCLSACISHAVRRVCRRSGQGWRESGRLISDAIQTFSGTYIPQTPTAVLPYLDIEHLS